MNTGRELLSDGSRLTYVMISNAKGDDSMQIIEEHRTIEVKGSRNHIRGVADPMPMC